jgi:hypothetical protein
MTRSSGAQYVHAADAPIAATTRFDRQLPDAILRCAQGSTTRRCLG